MSSGVYVLPPPTTATFRPTCLRPGRSRGNLTARPGPSILLITLSATEPLDKRTPSGTWPASGSSLGPVPAPPPGLPRPASALDAGEWQAGRPAAARAGARRALRLQPDHGPPRARGARPRGPDRADPRPRHVRPPAPRSSSTSAAAESSRARCRATASTPRRRSWRRTRRSAGEAVANALGPRDRRADAVRRAAPARRRRADAPRAGPPAGRPLPGPARLGPRAQLALRPAHRALRDPRRPGPRGDRADPAPGPRGGPARAAQRPARAARRGRRLCRRRGSRRVRPELRPRRPDSLLRRAPRGALSDHLVDRPGGGAGRGCRHRPAGRRRPARAAGPP